MDLWLYVYGNGDFIYSILNSVNFFMNHAMSFFKVSAVISLLIFAFEATGTMPTRNYDWTRFIKIYLLISIFVLTPYPGKVTVQDELTDYQKTFNPSSNKMPIGLILPMAVTSTIMHQLINLYQQNFDIDSNLNYSVSGMNFGANFILGLDSVNSYDDLFNYNLDNYMQNCGFPLLYKAGKLYDLRTNNDIFTLLKQNSSQARFVQQIDFKTGRRLIKTCQFAITDIDDYYILHKDKILMDNARMMGVDTNKSVLRDRFINAADAVSSKLLGVAQGSAGALKQAIAMNIIMTSVKNGAQSVGNGSLALAVYDTEQFQQYKKVGELSGSASARTIPILVGVGFALLFFLYPIMVFLAIARGSYKAIGVFFQILIAINLIPLIYEILNYISTYYLQKKLGITITGSGFNYDVSTSLYSFTDNMIVAGNYLATSAPLIAYAIVSGSAMALTSVFGHINDPAKSQAQQVGTEQARGNQNLGNVSIDNASFNNTQGNKFDDQFVTNSGVPVLKDVNSGGVHSNIGGKDYDQNHKSDLLSEATFKQMESSTLQNSVSHMQQTMGELSKKWGQQAQRLHELGNSIQSRQSNSLISGSDEANNLAHAQTIATRLSGSFGVNGSGSGAGMGGNSEISDKINHDLKEYEKYTHDLSNSSDQTIKNAVSNTSSLTTSSSETIRESLSISQALNDMSSKQSSITTNYNNELDNYIRNQGLEPTKLDASEENALAQSYVNEKLNKKYGIKTELSNPTDHGIDKLAHGVNVGQINSQGLNLPINNVSGSNLHDKANNAIKNFKNNQGNVLGEQVIEQGKTGVNAVKNVGQKATEVASEVLYDVAHIDEIFDK